MMNQKQKEQRESLIEWRKVIRTIARKGFLKEAGISWYFARRLTDPMFVNPPARLYRAERSCTS